MSRTRFSIWCASGKGKAASHRISGFSVGCRLAVTALAACCATAQAANLYVSPKGADSRPGTAAQPFRTVARAVNKARPGDTILLADGVYTNEGHISDGSGCWHGCAAPVVISRPGTPRAWIALKAEHKWGAVLDCGTTAAQLGCDTYLDFAATASYWIIQDLVITRSAFSGIHDSTASHLIFKGNRVEYIGNFYTTTTIGISGIGFAAGSTDIRIEGNVIHDVGRTGGLPYPNHDHGIYAGGKDVVIVNNIFYNNLKGWDIQTTHGSSNWLIANNTFAFREPGQSGHIMLWDGDVANSISNFTIRDNIFDSSGDAAVVTRTSSGTAIPGCSIRRNLTSARSIYSSRVTCEITGNRVETDPNLRITSAAPYDFHPQPGSPAIRWGDCVPDVDRDFDGRPRPKDATCDAGAYEH